MHTANSLTITRHLTAWQAGDEDAPDRLMRRVYGELRQLARGCLRRDHPCHTLQPTALIHEAYLRLADDALPAWRGRRHFFGIFVRLMRQVLVDHARRRQTEKRGRGQERIGLEELLLPAPERPAALVALDEALAELAAFDPRKARLVELRFFAGHSIDELAAAFGLSVATVGRELRLACAWLHRRLRDFSPARGSGRVGESVRASRRTSERDAGAMAAHSGGLRRGR